MGQPVIAAAVTLVITHLADGKHPTLVDAKHPPATLVQAARRELVESIRQVDEAAARTVTAANLKLAGLAPQYVAGNLELTYVFAGATPHIVNDLSAREQAIPMVGPTPKALEQWKNAPRPVEYVQCTGAQIVGWSPAPRAAQAPAAERGAFEPDAPRSEAMGHGGSPPQE
ncbi:hypothetical protein ACMHYB_39230 [Sorangium sp. So ce1128]